MALTHFGASGANTRLALVPMFVSRPKMTVWSGCTVMETVPTHRTTGPMLRKYASTSMNTVPVKRAVVLASVHPDDLILSMGLIYPEIKALAHFHLDTPHAQIQPEGRIHSGHVEGGTGDRSISLMDPGRRLRADISLHSCSLYPRGKR